MASERHQRGLSQRGEKNVAVIMPKISSAVTERTTQKNTKIDLSTAENWLIRPEVVNLCKEAIDTKFNAKVIRNVCLKPDNLMQHANNIQHFSYQSGFAGDSDVIDAFASFFNNHFKPHTPVESSQIATATGAAGCLDAVLYNICDPGDGVLVPTPYWSKPFIDATSWSFNSYVHNLADAFDFLFQARSSVTPIPVNVSNLGFTLTEAILPALEQAYEIAQCPIKGLILTNPHNPLGQCYPKSVLEGCLKFCNARNIHFVSDEIYALTSFACPDIPNPVPFVSALSIDVEKLGCNRSRVHTIWSTSKDFGQSGVRMGCTVTQSNRDLAVGLALAANTATSSLSAVFVTAMLTSPKLPSLISLNSQRLAEGYRTLTSFFTRNYIPYIPSYAGLYVFARVAPYAKSWEKEAMVVQRLKDAGVLVSAGRAYHTLENDKGWARVSFALPKEKLEEAVMRMQKVFLTEPAQG